MLRILLVDDEPLVLIGLQGMLEWEKLGYTVCGTARNGEEIQIHSFEETTGRWRYHLQSKENLQK